MKSQFDIFAEPGSKERLLLTVQSGVLDGLAVRMVIPLFPMRLGLPIMNRLNPVVTIHGQAFVVMTQLMAPIPVKALGPHVARLDNETDAIFNALDMLFKGF